ncbi:amidohydrolase family protein [uncultured Mailhella sp.]|uniref:amidohydrolase family protein n=1 Tax=uncultured Mailhella sp. TaxID=1981031 RepID=UPI002623D984|nr:amidohydrolase family protein [uncultured Mailhella sp.]
MTPVIDLRYRPSTKESIESVATNPVYAEYIKNTDFLKRKMLSLEECAEELRSIGIVKAVVSGRDIESTYDSPNTNASTLECVRSDPDLYIGFYGYDPRKGMNGLRAFRKALEQDGMRGASIDPCMNHYGVSDPFFYPLYAMCCDYAVPVVITAGLSGHMPGVALEDMAPREIDKVARDFPELKIVISHGGYPWVNEAIAVCMRHNNVYMDLSSCDSKLFGEFYIKAANEYITDKVVFASANPFNPVAKTLKRFLELPFTEEAKRRFFYANACTLLDLSEDVAR